MHKPKWVYDFPAVSPSLRTLSGDVPVTLLQHINYSEVLKPISHLQQPSQ